MRFRDNFFPNYLKHAPVPLALERSLECEILSKLEFKHPVLDIGCGDGLFAFILFDEEIDLGIDSDNRGLARAREYGIYQELIQCFGDAIPKEDKSFNTIFSNSTMEHMLNLEPVLKEAHRLLSDDGNFYITVPTDFFDKYTIVNCVLDKLGLKTLSKKYRVFFNKFWKHYHYYPVQEWINLFKKNGFKIAKTIEYGNRKTCLFDDFLVPLSVFSWLIKKISGRWTLLPQVRRAFTYPVRLLINKKAVEQAIGVSNGGLVFFNLQKK